MYEPLLKQIGLSDNQITVYQTLLKTGPIKASKLALKTPLKRVLVYKLLDDIVDLGLAEKEQASGSITLFKPTHPLALRELVDDRQKQLKNVEEVLAQTMPTLVSDFNLVSGKPGIRFFEGLDGLKKIYDDILETEQDIYLVRSIYEPVYSNQIVPIINEFIKKRVKKGISVTALTPQDPIKPKKPSHKDEAAILYNRTWVDQKHYSVPVEIDIYGDKIAILSFGKELIGVILESPQMTQAIKQLFLLSQLAAKQLEPQLKQTIAQALGE